MQAIVGGCVLMDAGIAQPYLAIRFNRHNKYKAMLKLSAFHRMPLTNAAW
jgi:hypothetical protein